MPLATLKDVIPILDVRSIDRAMRYYVERLGFQLDFRYTNDPDNYAGVRRDGVYLHMQWQDEEHFQRGTAGRLRLRIVVDNPDALFDEYRAKGVFEDSVQVRDTDWGTREFGFAIWMAVDLCSIAACNHVGSPEIVPSLRGLGGI